MAQEFLRRLKDGSYDIAKEEHMLAKLYQALGQRGDTADKILAKIGLLKLQQKITKESTDKETKSRNLTTTIENSLEEESIFKKDLVNLYNSVAGSISSLQSPLNGAQTTFRSGSDKRQKFQPTVRGVRQV